MSTPQRSPAPYDAGFYRAQSGPSVMSARKMLSYLFETYRPASVVDVGCGTGAWLSVARDLGADDILGVDGDYVDPRQMRIDPVDFASADLERPLTVDVTADLCMCLEVAEHLSVDRAGALVRELTSLAPVVLFGAAIPGQEGTHHVNLQWPSYWAALFEANGYVAVDCMRIPFWDDPDVDFWYAQNTLVYVDRNRPDVLDALSAVPVISPPGLPLVHPELYHGYVYALRYGPVRERLRQIGRASIRAVGRRIGLSTRFPEAPTPPTRGALIARMPSDGE